MPADLKVTLLQHTPSPERAVASAGRLCYAPVSAAELKQGMDDDEVRRLVGSLVRSGHLSALEHATFTFAIDGISRACSHQLVRHRSRRTSAIAALRAFQLRRGVRGPTAHHGFLRGPRSVLMRP
jgi:flavin-dependent thymidylate synthase